MMVRGNISTKLFVKLSVFVIFSFHRLANADVIANSNGNQRLPLMVDEILQDRQESSVFTTEQVLQSMESGQDDDVVHVFQLTNGDIPEGTMVECVLRCTSAMNGDVGIYVQEGSAPTNLDGFTENDFGDCELSSTHLVKATTTVCVAAVSKDGAGLKVPLCAARQPLHYRHQRLQPQHSHQQHPILLRLQPQPQHQHLLPFQQFPMSLLARPCFAKAMLLLLWLMPVVNSF